jgi:hypothetical protein
MPERNKLMYVSKEDELFLSWAFLLISLKFRGSFTPVTNFKTSIDAFK